MDADEDADQHHPGVQDIRNAGKNQDAEENGGRQMRKMAEVTGTEKQVIMTTTFLGYNHNEIIGDGEMFDMQNLSGDQYPTLSPRKKRGITSYDISGQAAVTLHGIHGRDQLVMIRGTEVFYNFVKVNGLSVSESSSMLPKTIVSMGAYCCIWPDKKFFNTIDLSDHGSMDRTWSMDGSNIGISLCRPDGTNYDMTTVSVGATAPTNPTNGKLWIDQSGETDVLRQYTTATQEWAEVPTVYLKIAATGIGAGIREYDGVTLSGLAAPDGATDRVKDQVKALNTTAIIYGAGDNYIIVVGILSTTLAALKSGTVRADRAVPDVDFVCESNNRLWGCRYGMVGRTRLSLSDASCRRSPRLLAEVRVYDRATIFASLPSFAMRSMTLYTSSLVFPEPGPALT